MGQPIATHRAPSFTGTWHTTFGRLVAEQEGGVVRGRYDHKGGTISGEISGDVLRGTWAEPEHGKEGTLALTLDHGNNTFSGTWAHTKGGEGGGAWTGVRLDLLSAEEGGNPGGWNSHSEGPLLAGPMLGEAGENEARVWAQGRDTSTLSLVVSRDDGSEIIVDAEPSWDEWLCASFLVEGLKPNERCSYEIRSRNGKTARHVLRAGPPRDARRLKLVFGSCYWNFPDNKLAIFDSMGREKADVFVLLGDTSYFGEPDWQTEHTMMLAHLRHRNNEAMRRLVADVPTIGVWDDHDFGPNDADSTFAGKTMAAPAFKRSWANASYGTSELPGIFSAARMGPADLIWIDTRSYRIDANKSTLGEAQFDWLTDRLARSDAPVKIIASSSQVLPQFPVPHGWNCFRLDAPAELERLLSFIEKNDIQGVVFLSGDVHMGYLIHVPGRDIGGRRGPELWELTSSPLANDPWKEPQVGTDPYLVKEVADRTNYGIVDIDLDRTGREISLILKDERGGTFWDQPLSLADLRVR